MKRLILLITMCTLCAPVVHSQTTKGKILLGSSVPFRNYYLAAYTGGAPTISAFGFSSTKSKSDDGDDSDALKITTINILPKFGYFVADHLAVGLDFNLGFLKGSYGDEDDYEKYMAFMTGPFIRYYIPSDKILPFLEAGATFGVMSVSWGDEDDDKEKSGIWSAGGGAGLAFPLGEKVTLDLMAGYGFMSLKPKEDNEDNYREITHGLDLKLGFVMMLGK